MRELETPAQHLQVTACSVESGCKARALTVVGTRGKTTQNSQDIPPASEKVNVSVGVWTTLPFGLNVQKQTEASTGLFVFLLFFKKNSSDTQDPT